MPSKQPHINIFIAYSRMDTEYLQHLKIHLRPLERNYEYLNIWYDGEIVAGQKWNEEIKKHIHNDEIIILLISANSLASDYFYDEEVRHALERHRKGETIVIPIIVKACLWHATPVAELQALPQDGKPVSQWDDKAQAYANIADGINKNIQIAIEKKEKKIRQLLADARKTLDNKDLVKGTEHVDEILKIDPNNEAAEQLKLEINQAIKNQHKIVQLFDDAQETLDRNDYGQALEYIEKILQLNPNHKEAQELRLEVKQAIENQKRIALLLADARKAFDNKNFATAKEHIETIFKIYPNYEDAKELLPKINKALEEQKNIARLLVDARKALDDKDFTKAKEYIAAVFKIDPNHRKAKELDAEINQAIENQKKITQLLKDARAALERKNDKQAPKHIEKILQLDPNHKEAQELLLGINKAIEKQDRIAQLLADARKGFGNKNFTQAKEYVEEILKIDPNHKEAKELLLKINQALEKQNKIEKLLANTRKALDNKDFVKAKEYIAAVFEIDPNHRKAKELDAEINQAIENQKKIAQLLKDAHTALDCKDYEQAKKHARAALKLAHANEEAKDIIRQCRKARRGIIFKDFKNPLMIAILLAVAANISLIYKVLKKHNEEYRAICEGNCKNGYGELRYEDGRKYKGEWKDGKFHGEGAFFLQNNTIYNGEWKNNIMDGDGIRYYENGIIYDGNWVNGIREGMGQFTIPDIGTYNGAFENDMFNGHGTFIYSDGISYVGKWQNNRKHGQGTITDKNGKEQQGEWAEGVPVSSSN